MPDLAPPTARKQPENTDMDLDNFTAHMVPSVPTENAIQTVRLSDMEQKQWKAVRQMQLSIRIQTYIGSLNTLRPSDQAVILQQLKHYDTHAHEHVVAKLNGLRGAKERHPEPLKKKAVDRTTGVVIDAVTKMV